MEGIEDEALIRGMLIRRAGRRPTVSDKAETDFGVFEDVNTTLLEESRRARQRILVVASSDGQTLTQHMRAPDVPLRAPH